MNQLLKLDGIVAEGDVKLQRKMQVPTFNLYTNLHLVLETEQCNLIGGLGLRKLQHLIYIYVLGKKSSKVCRNS